MAKKMNSRAKPMSGDELARFRIEFLQFGQREAARRLGMSREFLRKCEINGAPLYIAYACAAIKSNLKPLGIPGPINWNDHKGAKEKAALKFLQELGIEI